jgi:hypothetical protein
MIPLARRSTAAPRSRADQDNTHQQALDRQAADLAERERSLRDREKAVRQRELDAEAKEDATRELRQSATMMHLPHGSGDRSPQRLSAEVILQADAWRQGKAELPFTMPDQPVSSEGMTDAQRRATAKAIIEAGKLVGAIEP